MLQATGVRCLLTRVTCTLAALSSAEARAQLYGAQVDPSPRVSDVIVLQMQRLVALLYKTNHRSEPEHQNKPSRLSQPPELHRYQMTDNIKDTKPSQITGHVIVLKEERFQNMKESDAWMRPTCDALLQKWSLQMWTDQHYYHSILQAILFILLTKQLLRWNYNSLFQNKKQYTDRWMDG